MEDAQRLSEIEQIKTLKAQYFRFLDTKQWDQWRGVFTDDLEAYYDEGPGGPTGLIGRGGDAVVEIVSSRMRDSVTVHHGHTPEIELTSPVTATGIWAMSDLVQHPPGAPRPSILGTGHYHEEYRKAADGRWRISRFHLTRLHIARLDLAAERWAATSGPRLP